MRDRFERTLKKCEDYPDKPIKPFNGNTVNAEDFLRLKPEEWLDDLVIEVFLKPMGMKSTHATNHRFVILSSLLWVHVERNEHKSLKRVFRGPPL